MPFESFNLLKSLRRALALAAILSLSTSGYGLRACPPGNGLARESQAPALSKTEFEIIEGHFHDALGTYAEVALANELITRAGLSQPLFDPSVSKAKMGDAINRLPLFHESRANFKQEILHIEAAVRRGAVALLERAGVARMTRVRQTPREFAGARAGDLRLEFAGRGDMPVSVKTDKSKKVAVAEGQTPDIQAKWAERYFRVSPPELSRMVAEVGFSSMTELKSHYLNVSRLVAHVIITRLKLTRCEPENFSSARVGDMEAVKYLFRRLLHFKHGNDDSCVIIFDRSTGEVKWESLLEGVDIEKLTPERISFLPSRPSVARPSVGQPSVAQPSVARPIASEFGIKIDGKTVVTFQIKHKRGAARGTIRQYEFSDITTRLRI
jgi:hypothetical protein